MLFQILKKDLLKRRGINIILFIFITLSTIFLASSINNILVVSSGIDYYLDYANIADVNMITHAGEEKNKISLWLDDLRDNQTIDDYFYEEMTHIPDKAIEIKDRDGTIINMDGGGDSLYLGKDVSPYNKAYDLNGKEFQLSSHEIALPITVASKNHLNIGDTINIEYNNEVISYKLTTLTKDAAFGNGMVGMSRLLLNEKDYDSYFDLAKIGIFNIDTKDTKSLIQQINQQEFSSIFNTITGSTYQLVYSFDMIIAGLLIVIGVCLILIALLVLRFTLVFTMEQQYQEIGILKAIGLKDFDIKKMYLIKYLAIVSMGALIGLILSVPVSTIMINNVSYNMIMESTSANIIVNILSALGVVVLVLLFCYFCTRKLNKISAISAIRNGDTGESFKQHYRLNLFSKKRMKVPFYLGLNDILSHLRRYFVLIITFCLSFILITIPLNTLNTMRSDEMISKFSLDIKSAAFIRMIEDKREEKYSTALQVKDKMKIMEQQFKDKGYDTSLKASVIYFIKLQDIDRSFKKNYMTMQVLGENNEFLEYTKGTAPVLENEIAVSKMILEENDWQIGDSVYATVNQQEKEYIITGTYTDYMQLGRTVRLNPALDVGNETMFDYWAVMMDMDTSLNQQEVVDKMSSEFPEYEWTTAQSLVDQNVGGIQTALEQLTLPMTLMLCLIIMLITVLMERMLIIKEKGEIAMLKSIGMTYQTIRDWQVTRMILVTFTSMLISIPLSLLSNHFVLKPIFAIMGADIHIQINPLQVYILYPGLLLLGIIIATTLTARSIKKIDIRDINNIE